MPTPKNRKEKLNEILDMLRENNGKTTFGKLFGRFAMEYGTSERTFWDYLETLKMAGKIDYGIYRVSQKKDLEIFLVGEE